MISVIHTAAVLYQGQSQLGHTPPVVWSTAPVVSTAVRDWRTSGHAHRVVTARLDQSAPALAQVGGQMALRSYDRIT